MKSILNQIDDWFEDLGLSQPIAQFSLNDDDETKLATIAKTTTNWFKSLSNPRITREDVDDSDYDGDKCMSEVEAEAEDNHLDLLAKDLEYLLEDDDDTDTRTEKVEPDESSEPIFYLFDTYLSDDIALKDDTIGQCCTIESVKNAKGGNERSRLCPSSTSNHHRFLSVVMPPSSQSGEDSSSIESRQKEHSDLSKVQTPMARDHEYLAKPRTKQPLVMSNRLILKQEMANAPKRVSSVLNTAALKRFARFSNEFKILSLKHEASNNLRMLAIEQ